MAEQIQPSPRASKSSALKTFAMAAHPFLLAIAPIVHLYSRNMAEADIKIVLIFAGGGLAMSAILLVLIWFWQRSLLKAALLVSLFNVLFYSYGLAFDFIMQHEPFRLPYDTWHVALILVWLAILVTAGVVLHHSRRNYLPLAQFLTGALSIFLILCIWHIAHHELRSFVAHKNHKAKVQTQLTENNPPRVPPQAADSPDKPDVYYIILDGYARNDTLARVCQYDNSEFLEHLRSRGFYIAEQSCSNYPMTFMSIASSLNMCYLDEELKSPGFSDVYALWNRPKVAQVFQSKGYRFVYLATNFKTMLDGADIVYQSRPAWLLNQFAETLLRTTALRFFEPQMADQHLYQFDKVAQIAEINGPTFTFCHIIAPHPPYVFDRSGNVCCNVPQSMFFRDGAQQQQDPANDHARRAYTEQIRYVNQRMEEIVDSLLAKSKSPPIIIIQGDHGSFFTLPSQWNDNTLDQFAEERLPILNAYLVPEQMRGKLRPDISPVNSFRLLFNECFDEHFDLLPEKHYVGWYYQVENLRDATAVVHASAVQGASTLAQKSN